MSSNAATRLSVDIGGTFTDVVLERTGATPVLATNKQLTTYADPALGVMQGVAQALADSGIAPNEIDLVLHGTTLATNALIERRGANTALLTTAGHRDALEMAFENRFEQYDVNIDRPAPLVPRYRRIGIPERIDAQGHELVTLDERAVLDAVQALVDDGANALAVGYLHSYRNPAHEQRTAELVASRFPELSVTLSCEVCPEIREYERLSTTVANAYVKPLMSTYLHSLQASLEAAGIGCPVMLMTSGGGLTTLATAAQYPIRLVESGPAGGAILAGRLARRHGLDAVLSFDMGGTTAKICLIDDGEPLQSRSFEVDRSYRFKKGSGLPVRIPVIEMVEIGAGGGSVAQVDRLQRLLVGPESAGSEPGPACYGRGGARATVTDADVVLGKFAPEFFAGGTLALDVSAASSALEQDVGVPLGQGVPAAAYAVSEIVEENMASAARAHAAEWGLALDDRCMVAFGGAAPLHAAALASKLHIGRVLIPQGAGVGSALGFLLAPVSFEVVRSRYMALDALQPDEVSGLFEQMRAEAAAVLDGAQVRGERTERRRAYMRYAGQGYEIAVDLQDDPADWRGRESAVRAALTEAFEASYASLYGRTIPDMAVEVLSWTLSLASEDPEDLAVPVGGEGEDEGGIAGDVDPRPVRVSRWFDGNQARDLPIYERKTLAPLTRLEGPLLIAEAQTSVLVPTSMTVEVLMDGSLELVRKPDGDERGSEKSDSEKSGGAG